MLLSFKKGPDFHCLWNWCGTRLLHVLDAREAVVLDRRLYLLSAKECSAAPVLILLNDAVL